MEEAITINRISSQRQDDGYSLPQQAKANLEAAESRDGRRVVKEFNIVESARTSEKRDEFNEAVEYLKSHAGVRYVYIEKPDRLTRNLKDTVLAYDLVNNYDVTFVFTRDSFILNKQSNSHAKFQFDIKAVLAKNYIDNLSDEVKKGQRGMLEEGKWPGGACSTGYKKTDKLLVPDPPRDSYIIKTFELYASGAHSLKSLKREMDKQGFRSSNGKLLTISLYYHILTNPIYYGMMLWNGHLYEGKHQPLIDKQLFDRVQNMLARTKNGEIIPVFAKHDLTYKGVMDCGECHCKITGEEKFKTNKGNGYIHRWVYYHHSGYKPCDQKGMVREEEIDRQIMEVLEKLSLGPKTTEWLKNKLRESHQEEIAFRDQALSTLNVSLIQVRNRLDQVYDDKLDGTIDEETYNRKRGQFLADKAGLEEQIKRHSIASDQYLDFGSLVLDVANRAGQIYQVRKPEEKRYLLKFVFSNLSLMDKKVKFSFNSIFQAVHDYSKTKDELAIVNNVRTIIQQQNEYIYIPDLRMYANA